MVLLALRHDKIDQGQLTKTKCSNNIVQRSANLLQKPSNEIRKRLVRLPLHDGGRRRLKLISLLLRGLDGGGDGLDVLAVGLGGRVLLVRGAGEGEAGGGLVDGAGVLLDLGEEAFDDGVGVGDLAALDGGEGGVDSGRSWGGEGWEEERWQGQEGHGGELHGGCLGWVGLELIGS